MNGPLPPRALWLSQRPPSCSARQHKLPSRCSRTRGYRFGQPLRASKWEFEILVPLFGSRGREFEQSNCVRKRMWRDRLVRGPLDSKAWQAEPFRRR